MLFWPVLIIGLAVFALFLSGPPSDGVFDGERAQAQILYLTILGAALLIVGAGRLLVRGGRKTLVHMAVWIGTVAGLVTAFAFRDQAATIVTEIRGELMPSMALSRTEGEELRRGWDGHYRADAEINGITMRMMIDTGASMVLIPYEDVAKLGVAPASLDYTMPVTTANGRSSVAPITISSIKIGKIVVFDIPAAVAQPGRLKTGLLGMSFLDRLSETSFQGERLILRQQAESSRFIRAPSGG
jgi:aspartyl protease family protein